MTLPPGAKLGSYAIVGPLGAGGMGEVYRARDARLEREVAIKVLPEAVARDPERLARFEREARSLAALNHPNIATVHGLERSGDDPFLVMELVEGPTLADRIARGALPLEEAIPIFRQIAEGLEAAHERGIVHRDLKPANVKVTGGGIGAEDRVKILDFGLAKALSPEAISGTQAPAGLSESPTLTYMATMRGEILGTASYMSPEQARGKAIDRRTDVWAFGVCLYEALSGERPFQGETPTDVIARVVTADPDWDALPAAVPAVLRRLLARCLERDPRRRLRDIGEAWVALDAANGDDLGGSERGGAGLGKAPTATSRGPAGRLGWLAAGAVLALVASWAVLRSDADAGSAARPARRLEIDLGPTLPIPVLEIPTFATFSPDGGRLAVVLNRAGTPALYLRDLEHVGLEEVAMNEDWIYSPAFSPDGEWIVFHDPLARLLKKVSLRGGGVESLSEAYPPLGATWLEDGSIVFSSTSEDGNCLRRVSSAGGAPVALDCAEPGFGFLYPRALPGDRGVLFQHVQSTPSRSGRSASGSGNFTEVRVLDLGSAENRPLVEDGSAPGYARSGHLLWVRRGGLWAVPFDLEELSLGGPEVPVESGLLESGTLVPWTVSSTGLLAYAPATNTALGRLSRRLVWLDRQGKETPFAGPAGLFRELSLSPDGHRVALVVPAPQRAAGQLWIYHDDGRAPVRLTDGQSATPVWTPDGKGVTFLFGEGAKQSEVRTLSVDVAAPPAVSFTEPVDGFRVSIVAGWTPDGRELIVIDNQQSQRVEAMVLSDAGESRRLVDSDTHVPMARVSPDGHWLGYLTPGSASVELWVTSYPRPGPQIRVAAGVGSFEFRWSRDGRELLYYAEERMMAASFEGGSEPRIGTPEELFRRSGIFEWDVAADGRILANVPEGSGETTAKLVVVDGFFDELRRLAPVD